MPTTAHDQAFGTVLNPGTLRHQITWQRRTVTGQNSFGDDVVTWGNLVTLKADVRSMIGKERAQVSQIWAEAQYRIVQPYYAGLTPQDRISWYADGVVRLLDVLDIQDAAGTHRTQIVVAKDHVE